MESQFDIPADLHTPVSAFLRLEPFAPRYLLESVEAGHLGRYSFIGFGPTKTRSLAKRGGEGEAGTLTELRSALAESPSFGTTAGQPFGGGLVGVAAFDLVRDLYRLPSAPHGSLFPVAAYMATESVLVFDHLSRRIALLHSGPEADHRSLKSEVKERLRGPLVTRAASDRHQRPSASMTKAQFESAVGEAKRHIEAGDVYQLVLSIKFTGETELDPFQTYRALRLLNPSPYMYFLDFEDFQVVGSSPEALARLSSTGSAELRPIAGTRPRGSDEEQDTALERQLLADAKEAAEHVMLVDLARNDLGRTAIPGSVAVDPFRAIERYSHVMHMVSGVTGTLRPDLDAFDLFAATFPAGTVTGAPKLRAIELIDELEPVSRDLYSGTVGYFGHGGAMDQAITIRSVFFRSGIYSYQAGAGIVADSDPSREHLEVLAKAAAMEAAFDLVEEGM